MLTGNPAFLGSKWVLLNWRVIAVAEGAIARHFAFRTMALHASGPGGHDGIRRVRALRGIVAFHARHARVFRVIEMRANHPTIRHGRRRNRRRRD